MKVTQTKLTGVLLIELDVYADGRGHFLEVYNEGRYKDAGIHASFNQDNLSFSKRGVIRGLHFQFPNPQGKLVSVLDGEVLDVVVDIRKGSPTFGEWIGEELSAENHRQLWIPPGFAHGFAVLGSHSLLSYKVSGVYDPRSEHTLRWDDQSVGVQWPIKHPVLSAKDEAGLALLDFPASQLVPYVEADKR